jgi:hypothetical protein
VDLPLGIGKHDLADGHQLARVEVEVHFVRENADPAADRQVDLAGNHQVVRRFLFDLGLL